MCRKEQYKDLEKHRITCRKQRRRYYAKTAVYKPSTWTDEQIRLVLERKMTDHELSAKIGHSVKAIQIKRSRLKKKGCELLQTS